MERLRIDEDPTRSTTKWSEKPPPHVPKPEDGHEYVWTLGCMWATPDQIKSWEQGGKMMDLQQRSWNNTARENTNPA